jgi:lipid A 3-O-deacylase
MELAYRFDDRSRLGLSLSHYSNASLSDKNPGTEAIMINYSIPFTTISSLF